MNEILVSIKRVLPERPAAKLMRATFHLPATQGVGPTTRSTAGPFLDTLLEAQSWDATLPIGSKTAIRLMLLIRLKKAERRRQHRFRQGLETKMLST
jgi:hypothetical protein